GRLIDEAAAPVAGATVRMLRPSAFGPALAYLQHDWIETRSAVDGTFRLDGLAPGIYALWAEAASRAPVIRGGLELAAELPNGQLDAGDLRLPSGRTVIVECRPVPRCGSHATLTTPGADWLPMTVPWSGDLATLGPIAPGPATLRISDRRGVLHERTVDIAEGEPETRIRVRLAGVEVTGRVVRNGKPVESGQVVLSPSSGAPPRFIQIAQRGASGTIGNEIVGAMPRQLSAPVSDGGAFRLSDVAPGQYTATWSSAAAQSAPQRVTIGESVTPLRIELSGGAVAGLVRAHDGAPQPHALVTAEQGTRRTNVMAAADGTFSVVGLEPGAVTLRASSGPSAIAAATATVTDGQTEHVELTLDDAKETAFDVSVTAAAAPLANAYVFLHDAGSLRAVTTGADGSAAFRIRPGDRPLTIAIYSPAFGWTFAGASTTTGKLSINITAATAGLLLNADRPGPVTIDAPGGFPLHAALAILGIPTITPLRIDHLPRGTYTIRTLNRQELVTLSDRVRDLGM
ncbi:MAG: hypothetical protein QOH21_2034, partial [Acidobacteriota bacterium]|nr:hypothetical protein [Acidobacteriota bacterium]